MWYLWFVRLFFLAMIPTHQTTCSLTWMQFIMLCWCFTPTCWHRFMQYAPDEQTLSATLQVFRPYFVWPQCLVNPCKNCDIAFVWPVLISFHFFRLSERNHVEWDLLWNTSPHTCSGKCPTEHDAKLFSVMTMMRTNGSTGQLRLVSDAVKCLIKSNITANVCGITCRTLQCCQLKW